MRGVIRLMSEYFFHYTESNLACAVIFAIMLAHDVLSVDRQEKQIKFDHTLASFIAYFISDSVWAAVTTGTLPKTLATVALTNFSNFIIMALINTVKVELYLCAISNASFTGILKQMRFKKPSL